MRKDALYFGLITLGILLVFTGIFSFLQHSGNYQQTLGKVSKNYERTGSWDNSRITKVSKPYQKLEDEKLSRWDADIYHCIKERLYSVEEGCYSKVRAAFFPLFPLFWRLTHAGFTGISLINFLLFALSIGLLIHYFSNAGYFDKTLLFALLISLPSTVIYFIPYSEALFLFTMTIAAIGLIKKKYGLYFVGSLLLAMVRPATLFIFIAILIVETLFFTIPGKPKRFIWNLFRKTVPFFAGYALVWAIQFVSSSSPTAFFDAGKLWEGGIQPIHGISDWSVEGFALSSFSVFFVSIPAFAFALFYLIKGLNTFPNMNVNSKREEDNIKYFLFLISVFYLAGIFSFTLITSGGNLHSFFRFTLASPPFYILCVIIFDKVSRMSGTKPLLVALFPLLLLIIFLYSTSYGGSRADFSFWGLYLFVLNAFFFITFSKLGKTSKVLLLTGLVFLNLIWNSYMFNIFLSNGWIFT